MRLPSTIADELLQTFEFAKYEGQLDRFIEHLGQYGITLVRDTPLQEQSLPTVFSLLEPRPKPTDMPMKVDILSYEPPRTPKKASKRRAAKAGGSESASKSKAKINAKAGKRQRGSTGGGVDEEEEEEWGASGSGSEALTPSTKRVKI